MGTKKVREQILFQIEQKKVTKGTKGTKNGNYSLARPRATYCGLIWPLMVLHDLIYMAILWYCTAFLWSCVAFLWFLWQNTDLNGLELSFLAVIDPNSFSLVKQNSTFEDS